MHENPYLLFGAVCFFAAGCAEAKEIYVAQNAAGGNSGVDVANAHSIGWLNTAGNWGGDAGDVSPGDTVILNGTFTSSLNIPGSGSAGNVVTIQFAPGAKFSKPVWGVGAFGAIYASGKSYITIDGGSNGLIECTNNGTTLGSQVNCTGIQATGMNFLVIKNMTITRMYQRTPGSATDANRFGYPIDAAGSNITIQNNTLADGDTIIGFSYATGAQSNWTITGNSIRRCNHGITLGTAQPGSLLSNVSISNNTIDDLDVWDGNPGLHLDGMIIFDEDLGYTSKISDLYIYNNTIGPDIGRVNTAGIFIDNYQSGSTTNLRIYNNLFLTAAGKYWNNGCVTTGLGRGTIVANNTFYHLGASPAGIAINASAEDMIIRNNLIYKMGTAVSLGSMAAGNWPDSAVINNNVYYGLPSGSGAFYGPGFSAHLTSEWLARAERYDVNSAFTMPLLDANYVPTTLDTVARNKGVNLSTWFTTDKNETARPPTGAWTIGAFQAPGTNLVADIIPPVLTITTPTAIASYTSSGGTVNIGGTATDNTVVAQVTWSSDRGGSGTPEGTPSNWRVNGIALQSGENVITVTARDSAGNLGTDKLTVTYAPAMDTTAPVITITTPIAAGTYTSSGDTINLGGTATDNVAVAQVTWSSDRGGSGTDGGPIANWAVAGIPLRSGENVITVTARDDAGNSATDSVTITYTPPDIVERKPGAAFAATGGSLTTPFIASGNAVFQPTATDLVDGGRASYQFTVDDPGEYAVTMSVDAPHDASNSFFLNVDNEPQDPQMVWDVLPLTTGFETRNVSWRGTGNQNNHEPKPKYFTLGAGQHELIIRGREGNVKVDAIKIVKRPAKVSTPRFTTAP